MVNKTKKRNKRRYFTYLKKRQTKRMYGGDIQPTNNQDSLLSRLGSIGVQTMNNVVDYGINSLASVTGTDAKLGFDKSYNDLLNRAENISNVIVNTQLGDKLANQLGEATEKILKPVEEKGSEILDDFIEKQADAGVGLAANLAEDIAYPIVAPIRTLASVAEVAENTAEAAAEATGVLKDQVDAYNSVKDQIGETINSISEAASGNIENIEKNPKIPEMVKVPEMAKVEQPEMSKLSESVQLGGGSLKKYSKEARLIGGRISASQSEFLSPYGVTSQNSRHKSGKWHTRSRRKSKHRLTSHRR